MTRPPHHTRFGFRNPPGSHKQRAELKEWVRFFHRRAKEARRIPQVPEGHVVPRDVAAAALERAIESGTDSITWLGHASFLIRLGGRTILTDPYLTDWASPARGVGPKRYVPSGIPVRRLPPVDVLVLSHNHYDHLDTRALDQLPHRSKTVAVVPLKLGRYFTSRGFARAIEMDWEESARPLADDPLEVTCLPAVHFSSRTPFDRDRTLWASFGMRSGERSLWFAGDTGWGPVFEEMGARFGPFETALVPIGAYDPRPIMRAVHANPEEAVAIGRAMGARRLVAMHWGTVILTDEPPFEPPERFRTAARDAGYDAAHAWAMRVGETREL